ncbi:MAG: low molecular weight phosphotyrosine protein phosphatase [Rhodospirillales bacterium]|nr:low molecular weight phosphotyrosine protein phosphatase [Rhodospirillales bacterium]
MANAKNTTDVGVIFVCLGNICRSPTALGIFRGLGARDNLSDRIITDSAGTSSFHLGDPPDPRSIATARERGIDLTSFRSRQAKAADFQRFRYVVAMDRQNHRDLARLCPAGAESRLGLLLDYAPGLGQDVPDPYLGADGFYRVYDLIEAGCEGLLAHIRRTHFTV